MIGEYVISVKGLEKVISESVKGDTLTVIIAKSPCVLLKGNRFPNVCQVNPDACKKCGRCYTFPTAENILANPEGLLPSKPGFRYGYILSAAEKIACGEVSLEDIESKASYEYTVEALKKIKGIGDKVASCAALFGFANLEAFPIDVWMKRAIDTYFDGKLDPKTLGPYAGIAQQYIFHYIRNESQNS